MAALLMQRKGVSRLDQDTTASWRLADEVHDLAPEVARLAWVRVMRWGTYAVVLASLVAIPILLRTDQVIKVTAIFIYGIIGLSLVVLTGWAGQISLGQVGFVAIGAAVSAKCTEAWGVDLS
jgi:branched-chain amino acid transport system permease protein